VLRAHSMVLCLWVIAKSFHRNFKGGTRCSEIAALGVSATEVRCVTLFLKFTSFVLPSLSVVRASLASVLSWNNTDKLFFDCLQQSLAWFGTTFAEFSIIQSMRCLHWIKILQSCWNLSRLCCVHTRWPLTCWSFAKSFCCNCHGRVQVRWAGCAWVDCYWDGWVLLHPRVMSSIQLSSPAVNVILKVISKQQYCLK